MNFHPYLRRHWFRAWVYYWAEIANGLCGVLTLGQWEANIATTAASWLYAPFIATWEPEGEFDCYLDEMTEKVTDHE